jgi:hypothetical protein
MGSPFHGLNFDPQLACEFLAVFARFEFALKAARLAYGDNKKVAADWDEYARAIDADFRQLQKQNDELDAAVNYLINHPPKGQVLLNGKLDWRDAPPDANKPCAEQVLLMVRRVRNNLFHGGNFPPAADANRDRLLVSHSLVVLHACSPLHHDVEQAYAS